jgi:hypothetical protein
MSAPHDESVGPATGYGTVDRAATRPSGWVVGMVLFTATMMIVIGLFQALAGLVALFRNEIYVVAPRYLFALDLTAWGWIHLLIGIAIAVAGYALISGQLWARAVGIALALLSMISNFLFIPYYPAWSLLIITLDVFVVWALCLYNRDAPDARDAPVS